MNTESICCLIKKGPPLTIEGSALLFFVAQEMITEKKRRHTIKLKSAIVIVKTDFDSTMLGSIVGIKFSADICAVEKTHVEYIVNPMSNPSAMTYEAVSLEEATALQCAN